MARFWDRQAETLPAPGSKRSSWRASEPASSGFSAPATCSTSASTASAGLASAPRRSRPASFTVKDDLRDQYLFGMLVAPRRDVVRVHASSGTGRPTVVAYTRADLELWADVLARGLTAARRRGRRRPERDRLRAVHRRPRLPRCCHLDRRDGRADLVGAPPARSCCCATSASRPSATPSYALIAEVAAAEGIDLRALPIRAVFLGAEPMSEALQDEIADAMGATVYEQYDLSEVIGRASPPTVATGASCTSGRITTSPRSWTRRRACACRTARSASWCSRPHQELPVLRYRTRDRTYLTREPCPCGRTSTRIGKILGRTDDMLIVQGVNVFPSQIEHALLRLEGLSPGYQLVLTTRVDRQDELRVRIEARPSGCRGRGPRRSGRPCPRRLARRPRPPGRRRAGGAARSRAARAKPSASLTSAPDRLRPGAAQAARSEPDQHDRRQQMQDAEQ